MTIKSKIYNDNFDCELFGFPDGFDESLTEDMSPDQYQVGGDHYLRYDIQPIEFILRNELDFVTGNIIKYAVRSDEKFGDEAVEDLNKIIHYAQIKIAHLKNLDEEINQSLKEMKGQLK